MNRLQFFNSNGDAIELNDHNVIPTAADRHLDQPPNRGITTGSTAVGLAVALAHQ